MVTVSVCIVTYNQEDYIEQAIKGVLMQRDCDYEIIIANDASKDHTASICRSYKAQYSDKIRLIEQAENKGIILNTKDCLMAARGKYIAICEGDDYWIDAYKLKKQVDILENDSEISMVHTNWKDFYQEKGILEERKVVPTGYFVCEQKKGKESVIEILMDKYRGIRFSSICFRNSFLRKLVKDSPSFFNPQYSTLDIAFFYELAFSGKLYYMPDAAVVYRIQNNSVSISNDLQRQANFTLGCLYIYVYYMMRLDLSHEVCKERMSRTLNSPLMNILYNSDNIMATKVYDLAQKINYKFSLGQLLILVSPRNRILSEVIKGIVKYKLRMCNR